MDINTAYRLAYVNHLHRQITRVNVGSFISCVMQTVAMHAILGILSNKHTKLVYQLNVYFIGHYNTFLYRKLVSIHPTLH